jgi:hypothetical protein
MENYTLVIGDEKVYPKEWHKSANREEEHGRRENKAIG